VLDRTTGGVPGIGGQRTPIRRQHHRTTVATGVKVALERRALWRRINPTMLRRNVALARLEDQVRFAARADPRNQVGNGEHSAVGEQGPRLDCRGDVALAHLLPGGSGGIEDGGRGHESIKNSGGKTGTKNATE
jgi:hypothetical protein